MIKASALSQKENYLKWFLACFLWGLLASPGFSQILENKDYQLAEEYFTQQEYDKAKLLYERLARNNRYLSTLYRNYLTTLFQLKEFKDAEKLVDRAVRLDNTSPIYRIDRAYLHEVQGQRNKAEQAYAEVVEEFQKGSSIQVLQSAEHFLRIDHSSYALEILLGARKGDRDRSLYAVELADVYEIQGEYRAMIDEYLLLAVYHSDQLEFVKGALQDRVRTEEQMDNFEQNLLLKLQKDSDEIIYNELLLWLYLQQKRFYRAFVQAKAIDKRKRSDGEILFEIGKISLKNGDYKSAKTIFKYIIDTYPRSPIYPLARNKYIKAQEEIVKNSFPVEESDIHSLIDDYKSLIREIGLNNNTFDALRSIALLNAFYLDRKDTAVQILNQAITISRSRPIQIAKCKIDLGDIYLLKNEPWESTLLYSQVEKLRKESPLGYESKLKNAQLSFYKGEFSLAQEHLDILKEATTREIANDAMELSLMIRDNLVFDTTGAALLDYSKTQLMMFQNKNLEALSAYQKMLETYPGHTIEDEVLWSLAQLHLKMGKIQEAIGNLEKIIQVHGEDILGDDAHFLLAKTYEEVVKDRQKAMEIYKDHLTKYPGSIYTAEARKRFRILRGDFPN